MLAASVSLFNWRFLPRQDYLQRPAQCVQAVLGSFSGLSLHTTRVSQLHRPWMSIVMASLTSRCKLHL